MISQFLLSKSPSLSHSLSLPLPLSPGVLQVEAMAQLGGIVMMDPEDKAAQQNFFFGGIEGC